MTGDLVKRLPRLLALAMGPEPGSAAESVMGRLVVTTKTCFASDSIQFTILIDGAIGPQPHPSFIDVFC